MNISNSKPHLLPTQNPIFTLLVIFIFLNFPLINAQSGSVSFRFTSSFELQDIGFLGDASSSGEAIVLTRRDELGDPLQNSVGRAVYLKPVHIWDATTGNLADFTTVFYFVVNRSGLELHGDGVSFFMAPLDSAIPNNSTGGLLGLFSPETALENPSSKNQTLAVEFDSFANEWDPNPLSDFPHIGINVNSIKSVATVGWPSYFEPDGATVWARIRYDSQTKELFVQVRYPDGDANAANLSYTTDLRTVLPEWVRIGFSAATGDLIEAHDILFWSFKSSLRNSTSKEENNIDIVSI